jgi:hypothetical protein
VKLNGNRAGKVKGKGDTKVTKVCHPTFLSDNMTAELINTRGIFVHRWHENTIDSNEEQDYCNQSVDAVNQYPDFGKLKLLASRHFWLFRELISLSSIKRLAANLIKKAVSC